MKIVKESSACLQGYPKTLLDANHQDMCKFKNEKDINYKRVSGLLGKWAKQLKEPQKATEEQKVNTHAGCRNLALHMHILTCV